MSKQISFIHCADLHIDSPFKGLSNMSQNIFNDVKESTFRALSNLVELAIEKQVDFVLIVGDLFDSEQQSLKAQTSLRKAFERLKQHHIDVFISYGNHDFLNGRTFNYEYPSNVYEFDQEKVSSFVFSKKGVPTATIYGFSYQNRAVYQRKIDEYQKKEGETPFHIGTLHGSISTNTDHDVYAPFQLNDLVEKNFDYWALGHIHKRQLLKDQPPIVYPGNTQGKSKKELGEKGCYYVELNEHNCSLSFHALQEIRFEEVTVDATFCEQPQDLEMLVEQKLLDIKKEIGKSVIVLHLESESSQLKQWQQSGFIDELVDYFNDNNDKEDSWVYIAQFTIKELVSWNREELKSGNHFIAELVNSFDYEADLQRVVEPLFQHRQARKILDPLTDEEQEEIKKEAESILLYQLLRNE